VRAVALGTIVATIAGHLAIVARVLAPKVHRVADGADAFYADRIGLFANEIVREIRARTAPDATLLVAPQGVMLNYLARRRNPTPYYAYDRTSRVLWGDDAIVDSLEAHPPDWIVVFDRGGAEAGSPVFGRDVFQRGYGWIMEHYRPVRQFGAAPFQEPQGGAVLMQRTDG
jgi:hypothetical protein